MASPSTSVSASDDEMEGRKVSYLYDYDVLNGRGKDINNLAGNINFQRLIAGNKVSVQYVPNYIQLDCNWCIARLSLNSFRTTSEIICSNIYFLLV
jgi:hypothetical protein